MMVYGLKEAKAVRNLKGRTRTESDSGRLPAVTLRVTLRTQLAERPDARE
jgi:hypothetical protein